MLYLRCLISILIIITACSGCQNNTEPTQSIYLSLQQAKDRGLLLSNYQIKTNADHTAVKDAYSYLVGPKNKKSKDDKENRNQILLLRTKYNIEREAKFFALDRNGKTGKVFSTDSTYIILIEDIALLNKEAFTLYKFAIEKPGDKYQLKLKDSLFLESSP